MENFEEELKKISELIERYTWIAMDTEFPGIVIEELPERFKSSDIRNREYLKIKSNVDILKII